MTVKQLEKLLQAEREKEKAALLDLDRHTWGTDAYQRAYWDYWFAVGRVSMVKDMIESAWEARQRKKVRA